jgi:putative two-component system hydrogenase maturation factor HypX/HoxX
VRIGLVDAAYAATAALFQTRTREVAARLAERVAAEDLLDRKRRRRARDEQVKPLQAYRNEELARSHECFFGPERSYHEARRRFCRKLGGARTVAPKADPAREQVWRSA